MTAEPDLDDEYNRALADLWDEATTLAVEILQDDWHAHPSDWSMLLDQRFPDDLERYAAAGLHYMRTQGITLNRLPQADRDWLDERGNDEDDWNWAVTACVLRVSAQRRLDADLPAGERRPSRRTS